VGTNTHERYGRKGLQGELDDFARYAREVIKIQERNRAKRGGMRSARAFHAKSALSVKNAMLFVDANVPADLRQDCFQPGAEIRATVRLSNASGMHESDGRKDLRGIAVRLEGPGHVHDLLMSNFERPPAANAKQFMAMSAAVAGRSSPVAKLISLLFRLPPRVGVFATIRIIRNGMASAQKVDSLATQTYWSRGAILWGDAGPVRYSLHPISRSRRCGRIIISTARRSSSNIWSSTQRSTASAVRELIRRFTASRSNPSLSPSPTLPTS